LLLGFVAEPVIATALESMFQWFGLPEGAVDPVSLVLALLLATIAQMLFGELVPQNLALARPLAVARKIVPLQRGFSRICRPIISVFNNTANAIVRALGVEPEEELRSARTPAELSHLFGSSVERGPIAAANRGATQPGPRLSRQDG
jgi:CBS domain containing-hemolysin-like protein